MMTATPTSYIDIETEKKINYWVPKLKNWNYIAMKKELMQHLQTQACNKLN